MLYCSSTIEKPLLLLEFSSSFFVLQLLSICYVSDRSDAINWNSLLSTQCAQGLLDSSQSRQLLRKKIQGYPGDKEYSVPAQTCNYCLSFACGSCPRINTASFLTKPLPVTTSSNLLYHKKEGDLFSILARISPIDKPTLFYDPAMTMRLLYVDLLKSISWSGKQCCLHSGFALNQVMLLVRSEP